MTRHLTNFEVSKLQSKAKGWSYGIMVVDDLITLGNGQSDEATAYLPYEILMNPQVRTITTNHVLTPTQAWKP